MKNVMVAGAAALALVMAVPAETLAAVPKAIPAATATLAAAPKTIQKNFLIHEKEARKNADAEFPWFISESTAEPLDVNPCQTKKGAGDKGRSDARTLTHAQPDGSVVEQLVVYGSEAKAAKAFASLRSALKACPKHSVTGGMSEVYSATTLKLGDEALKVVYQNYKGAKVKEGGGRAVVVRRGVAIAVYRAYAPFFLKADDYPRNLSDAKKLVKKLCAFDPSCA